MLTDNPTFFAQSRYHAARGMDEAKRCPRCGLTNPGTALRCDCGWDFKSQTTARSYVQRVGMSEAQRKNRAHDQIIVGTLLIVGGTVATAASFNSVGGGIIFYGAIVVGVIKVFRALG